MKVKTSRPTNLNGSSASPVSGPGISRKTCHPIPARPMSVTLSRLDMAGRNGFQALLGPTLTSFGPTGCPNFDQFRICTVNKWNKWAIMPYRSIKLPCLTWECMALMAPRLDAVVVIAKLARRSLGWFPMVHTRGCHHLKYCDVRSISNKRASRPLCTSRTYQHV